MKNKNWFLRTFGIGLLLSTNCSVLSASPLSNLVTELLESVKFRSGAKYQKLHHPLETKATCAEALHRQWDFLPFGYYRRLKTAGLAVSELSDPEKTTLKQILKIVLSENGERKLESARTQDQVIHDNPQYLLDDRFKTEMYGYDNYELAVFGNPGESQWMLTLQGHHFYMAVPVVNDALVASTPLFFGEYPQVSRLRPQEDSARQLAKLLKFSNSRGVEITADLSKSKMLMRPNNPFGSVLDTDLSKAIRFVDMDPVEGVALNILIDSFLSSFPFSVKTAWQVRIQEIKRTHPETIRFLWQGAINAGRNHFVVLLGKNASGDGPELAFEQENVSDEKGQHIHSVIWSTKNFGGL